MGTATGRSQPPASASMTAAMGATLNRRPITQRETKRSADWLPIAESAQLLALLQTLIDAHRSSNSAYLDRWLNANSDCQSVVLCRSIWRGSGSAMSSVR